MNYFHRIEYFREYLNSIFLISNLRKTSPNGLLVSLKGVRNLQLTYSFQFYYKDLAVDVMGSIPHNTI